MWMWSKWGGRQDRWLQLRSLASLAGFRDMKCHLAGGEARDSVGGGPLPTRYTAVGLSFVHHTGSGTKLLERAWTPELPRVRGAGEVWGYSQTLSWAPLFLRLQVAGRNALTAVCAYAPNLSSEYPGLMETRGGVLQRPSGDSIVLLRIENGELGGEWFCYWNPVLVLVWPWQIPC